MWRWLDTDKLPEGGGVPHRPATRRREYAWVSVLVYGHVAEGQFASD